MFRGQAYTKPRNKSLVGALLVALLVFSGSQVSPWLGYLFAVATLVVIIVAMHMNSIWPRQARPEHALVFSLFWGLMIGAIAPFLVITFLEGGASAVYEIFTSSP